MQQKCNTVVNYGKFSILQVCKKMFRFALFLSLILGSSRRMEVDSKKIM